MSRVLVLDGDSRAALAIVRSLGRHGIKVIVASDKLDSIALHSKYKDSILISPSPETKKNEFAEFVLRNVMKKKYDMIIPVTETSIVALIDKLDEISKYTKIPMKKHSMKYVLDKSLTLKTAKKLKIPIPKTYFIKKISDIEKISKTISYPCVIKPRLSRYFNGKRIISSYRVFVESSAELKEKYIELHKEVPFPLIQEFIPGKGTGIFILMNKSKTRAVFAHKRIREAPASGGVSVFSQSAKPDTTLLKWSEKLLNAIKWYGVAMVEFRTDERDGIPKLMEINGRFWGSLSLAISSGVDFPYLLYNMMMYGDIQPVKKYRCVKWRWLKGDILHLLSIFFRKELNNEISNMDKIRKFFEFMKFKQKEMYYDVFSLDDIKPWIIEMKEFFFVAAKKILRGW